MLQNSRYLNSINRAMPTEKRERKRIPIKQPAPQPVQAKKDHPKTDPSKPKQSFVHNTVLSRIMLYCKNTGYYKKITMEQKQEIGMKIKDKFFSPDNKKKKKAYKIEVEEAEGKFKVLVYPSYFTSIMDAIVFNYFKNVP